MAPANRGRAVPAALTVLLLASPAVRAADDGDDEKNLLMGVVTKVENDRLVIRHAGKDGAERTVRVTSETSSAFVGFRGLGRPADRPAVGFAVKANLAKGDVAKSILYSPDFPPLKAPPNKHRMTAEGLFGAADLNADGRVDYVEYATTIFQSYKHLPDRFRNKLDQNGDDVLSRNEFEEALGGLDWWRLSRKTAEEWVKAADKNMNGQLDKEEAKTVIGSAHGKYDQLFAKLDRDNSGGLSASELKSYLEEAITGKKSQRGAAAG